jgi:hypothetical protein
MIESRLLSMQIASKSKQNAFAANVQTVGAGRASLFREVVPDRLQEIDHVRGTHEIEEYGPGQLLLSAERELGFG